MAAKKTKKTTKNPTRRVGKKPTKRLVPKRKSVKKSAKKKPAKRSAPKRKQAAKKRAVAKPRRTQKTKARKSVPKRKSVRRKASKPRRTAKPKKAARRPKRGSRASRKTTRKTSRGKEPVLLESLVSSPIRARFLRLLFRDPLIARELKEASQAIGMPLPKLRREAEALKSLGVITLISRSGKSRAQVATTFPFIEELQRVVIGSFPVGRDELLKTLKPVGRLKLVVVSGVFLNEPKARVDLLVVADRYSEKRLERAVRKIEQMVAAELRWAGMESKEFKYRYKMFDRFVRDITSHAHERVLEGIKL